MRPRMVSADEHAGQWHAVSGVVLGCGGSHMTDKHKPLIRDWVKLGILAIAVAVMTCVVSPVIWCMRTACVVFDKVRGKYGGKAY